MSNKKSKSKFLAWVDGEYIIGEAAKEEQKVEAEVKEDTSKKKHHEKGIIERLEEWIAANELQTYQKFYKVLSVALAVVIIACMLITVSELPSFGEADNPANNEVSQKYIEDAMEDTGAVNIVAGMILDYRAFDTFGESTVLFSSDRYEARSKLSLLQQKEL